ncbi:MAG: PAS domain S-box protein [Verrucomicrobiota bacterium]
MTTKNEGPKAPTDPVAVATGSPQVDSAQDLRKRAEEKARDMGHENLESLSPEEIWQALHELRVHQIELEMQNEELRRSRAELDAARARYFELYDFSPVGYCTLNGKGLILEANLTAATLLGMARDALVKQPLARLILPEDQDIYYRHHKQLFETGAPQVCELRILRADADPFWARIEATAAQDADGTSVYRTVMSDITVRKRNEEALRLSEQHWRVLFNSANDAVFVHEWNDQSAASPFLEVNDIACARLGYSREELLRMSPADLDAPESVPNAPDVIRTLRESGQAVFEAVHCAKDGCRIPVEISTRHFQLGGRPMVFSIARDISKIKQREQMYKAILTTAADGFWIADRAGRLCEVNDAYCVMSGYSRDELLRLRISDIEAAETPQETREHIERIIRQGGADCFETRHRRKDGSFMDLEVTTQFLNVQGGIFVVFLHDVTKRKQAEEMLELEAVRLQAQLELHKLMDAPPDQLLDFVLEAITKTIQSQFAFIGLMDQAEAVMTLHAWSKGALAQCAIETRPMHFPISEAGLWGECVRQRQPVIVNAYADAPDKKGYPAGHVPIERLLSVPIFDGERIVAVAAAANKSSDYTESDSIALTILTNRMWDILRRKQAEEALAQSARSNELLLDSLLHPAMLIRRDRTVVAVNRIAREMGVAVGRYCWQSFGRCEYIPPADRQYFEQHGTQPPDGTHCTFCLADVALLANEPTHTEVTAFGRMWDAWWVPSEADTYLHYAIDITEHKQVEKELQERTTALEEFNQAMVGREQRIIEIKEEVNALCQELGREPKYPPIWRKGSGS